MVVTLMALRDVTPGARVLFPDCGKVATVLFHTPCSSTIRYDAVTQKAVVVNKGTADEKTVIFSRQAERLPVSGGSMVEVLP